MEIVRRIEEQPYHWPITTGMFHVMAYLVTMEGLPTGLVYEKGPLGPVSKNFKNAKAKLVNKDFLQEERQGSVFMVKVGPNFDRVRNHFKHSFAQWKPIIEKTTDLFMRMNTDQAEVVATVIFAADVLKKQQNGTPSETEVLESVLQWKQRRKPPLDTPTIASAIRNLGMLRWLDVKPDARLPLPEEELVEA